MLQALCVTAKKGSPLPALGNCSGHHGRSYETIYLVPLMQKLFVLILIVPMIALCLRAQQMSDRCHVYMAAHGTKDVMAMQKLLKETVDPQELEKRFAKFIQVLGEFDTIVYEEQATTKSFRIPGTSKFVTVTVFYTDESMAAESAGSDSMLLSLVVADKKLETAQGAPNCVQAEVSIGKFAGKLRVKKVTFLNGKEYLIGLECERKAPGAAAD